MKQTLALCQCNVAEAGSVMPAKAGIQGDLALVFGYVSWIPAYAGMTPPRPTPLRQTDGLLRTLRFLWMICFLSWLSASGVFAQGGLSKQEADLIKARATRLTAEDLYDHGDVDKAIEQWREAIQLDPSVARAHHDLGLALRDTRQQAEALKELREAVRLDPRDASAQADLGDMLQEKGDIDGALVAYRTAVGLLANSAPLHSNLGYLLIRKGDLDGAITEWREATRIDPKYAPPYANLGEALENKGDKSGAVTSYEKFLELVPSAPNAAEVRQRLAALKGAPDK
jgi:Flp pilus assembly protein TadD